MKLTTTSNQIVRYTKTILMVFLFIFNVAVSANNMNVSDVLNIVDTHGLQNYPNPFTDRTTISYTLETSANVEIVVFNVLGRKVEVLEKKTKAPGIYNLEWNAQYVPEGIYILQLKMDDQIITKRMIKK